MYMFVFDGITLGIAEVNGSAHVSYMNTPQAKKLMALPDAPPNTDLSATRNEITKMLTADSGIDFPPAEIRIFRLAQTRFHGFLELFLLFGTEFRADLLPDVLHFLAQFGRNLFADLPCAFLTFFQYFFRCSSAVRA